MTAKFIKKQVLILILIISKNIICDNRTEYEQIKEAHHFSSFN